MRYIILYISVLFIALNSTSCSTEETDLESGKNPEEKGEVTLYFRNSGLPKTRALNDILESTIDDIDILAFEASGTGLFFSYRKSVDNGDIKTDPQDHSKKYFTVSVPKDNKIYKYVILANSKAEVDKYFASSDHKGDEKENLLSQIISVETSVWAVDANNYRRIPMWGESEGLKTIEGLNNHTIELYRSVASVDIAIDANVNFSLKEIYVFNRPTNGRIAPRMENFSSAQKRFVAPSLPVSMNIVDQITSGAQANPIAVLGNSKEYKNSIFLYETDKYNSENFLYATCLVLGGSYNGQTNYYRVDFAEYRESQNTTAPPTWEQGPPSTDGGEGGFVGSGDTYYPLLRNHRYNMKITGVAGNGSSTPGEAAQTQHSQLITEFTTWNSQNEDIYIDNNPYELKISKTFVNLKTANPESISLETTYPGIWTVDNITDSWFQCYVDKKSNNATVTVRSLNLPALNSTGYFKVKLMDKNKEIVSQLIKVEYK